MPFAQARRYLQVMGEVQARGVFWRLAQTIAFVARVIQHFGMGVSVGADHVPALGDATGHIQLHAS